MLTFDPSVGPRLAKRMEIEDRGFISPCWIWQWSTYGRGYGQACVRTACGALKNARVHRVFYTLARGAIADGMTIDHLCVVKACANPDHLEIVTPEENRRRQWLRQTHCKRGHPFAEHGRTRRNGARVCRICDCIRHAESYRRTKKRRDSDHSGGNIRG